MFAPVFFAPTYFAPRYFPEAGSSAVTVAGPYYFTAAALYVAGASAGLLYAAGGAGVIYVAGASAGQLSTE